MLSRVVQRLNPRSCSTNPSSIFSRYFSSDWGSTNSAFPERTELTRTPVVVEGCDYEHWFVVMEAPKGYPLRHEIVDTYIKTLAMALGSEEEAKKSIYSVSTKYYYAFGCKVSEELAFKIKSLPNVKWVLPDSYSGHGNNSYGGEPFLDGKVVAYDDKYHSDWIRIQNDDESKGATHPKEAKGKQKKQ
ncbi:multiple organellar RNA editing factor 7, mitochondrial-like isoform X2 [Durio zibethinus]|uniref:Multiple organellar RNA editing factor 7, mitochondrial-like isoform X2 n=1 Tax=Durio zibethinus TaxID=66656 RepID=A0A6P5X6G7_DURZI|nr:multiple organellar RNA editing factor 7, mitochondrial-like isoform X2 [Durio zibethinus]